MQHQSPKNCFHIKSNGKKSDGHKKYGLGFCYLFEQRRLFFPHSRRLIYETATEQWKIRPFFPEHFKKVINGFELAVFSLSEAPA